MGETSVSQEVDTSESSDFNSCISRRKKECHQPSWSARATKGYSTEPTAGPQKDAQPFSPHRHTAPSSSRYLPGWKVTIQKTTSYIESRSHVPHFPVFSALGYLGDSPAYSETLPPSTTTSDQPCYLSHTSHSRIPKLCCPLHTSVTVVLISYHLYHSFFLSFKKKISSFLLFNTFVLKESFISNGRWKPSTT